MATEEKVLKFVPFASSVESSFWVKYCQEKLDTIQLSEDAIDITASYTVSNPRLQMLETSLDCTIQRKNEFLVSGSLFGYNTIPDFSAADKNSLIKNWFLPRFERGLLNSVLLLTYADLKNHKVLYWFAIPALTPTKSIVATKMQWFSDIPKAETMAQHIASLNADRESWCPAYFILDSTKCVELTKENYTGEQEEEVIFGFFDPVVQQETKDVSEALMGWPMRNLVAFLSLHLDLGGRTVKILSYRPPHLREPMDCLEDKSILLSVNVPMKDDYADKKVVGWELNTRNKPGPKWVHLGTLLDETHLAIQAADLNLKLMKWRMIPSLQVDKLQSTKVLIVGAGTLGCNVARVLLGWGIRDITFVDYGKVSYSNPVRQSLFTLEDCRGKSKAEAAADALHKIAADVKSKGVVLSIPMPGHEEPDVRESVEALDQMVQDCDVVYLLTDTRESRWLPTVMAAAHNKMLINAALGLDSWLVMRHGGGLGCYFCNDVVAPENSLKNRTLDQQCTVTRPGLAPIASSMAVELMVALLHHPKQHEAKAPSLANRSNFSPTANDQDESHTALGIIPHQIRGSLVSYTMMAPTVPAFNCCTACGESVVRAYQNDCVDLVQKACNSQDSSFLEDLAGLTAFRADAANQMVDFEDDDWSEEE